MNLLKKLKSSYDIIKIADKSNNVLLCGAIGDALGTPFEMRKPDDPLLKSWNGSDFLGSTYHGLKPGEWSDDTAMSLILAESITDQGNQLQPRYDPDVISKKYVEWLYGDSGHYNNPKGVGGTIRRGIKNIKDGIHWSKSGIPESLGNGSAMRSGIIGACFSGYDINTLIYAVRTDSNMTHSNIECYAGALAIALATYLVGQKEEDKIIHYLSVHLPDTKVKLAIMDAYDYARHIRMPRITITDPNRLTHINIIKKLGISGNVIETVASSFYCFWANADYEQAVVTAILAAGDCDTRASIVGNLFGGLTKIGNMPLHWVRDIQKSEFLRNLDDKVSSKQHKTKKNLEDSSFIYHY